MLEEFVFADVGGDHFFDLAILEEKADAEVVDAGVVADDGEIFGAFAADGSDQIFGDAAEAEAAHEDGGAVGEIGDGGVGAEMRLSMRLSGAVYRSCAKPGKWEREAWRRAVGCV